MREIITYKKAFEMLFNYICEKPKTYLRVIFISIIVGVIEFVGITSILPAIAIFLGESSALAGLPKVFLDVLKYFSPGMIIGMYLVLILIQTILNILNENIFISAMNDWRISLSLEYIKNITNADFVRMGNLKPGEAEVIITRNIGYAVKLRYYTALFISDMILAVFYIALAAYISYHSLVLFCVLGGLFVLFNGLTIDIKVKHSSLAKEKYILVAKHISEYFSDIRGLLISSVSNFIKKIEKELFIASYSQKINDQINIVFKYLHQPIMLIIIAGGIFTSKFMFQLSNTSILAMLFVFYRAAPKLISVAKGYSEIVGDSPVDITPEIMKWESYKRKYESTVLLNENHDINFKNVTVFQENTLLLRDVSFRIPSKSLVAFIGKSGTGKSTILDVICGFKKIHSGKVTVGGVDTNNIFHKEWLEKEVSLLRAESTIVSGSIKDNIAYLCKEDEVNIERINDVVELTGINEFLSGRDDIDTIIEARGANLSAGQRQRILLARALYKNPKLLILDEPTSNLDKKTEADINKLIISLKGKMTIIDVSHRGDILKHVDLVYEVSNKSIILLEKGVCV